MGGEDDDIFELDLGVSDNEGAAGHSAEAAANISTTTTTSQPPRLVYSSALLFTPVVTAGDLSVEECKSGRSMNARELGDRLVQDQPPTVVSTSMATPINNQQLAEQIYRVMLAENISVQPFL